MATATGTCTPGCARRFAPRRARGRRPAPCARRAIRRRRAVRRFSRAREAQSGTTPPTAAATDARAARCGHVVPPRARAVALGAGRPEDLGMDEHAFTLTARAGDGERFGELEI